MNRNNGFTIVELVIVIAVITILAAVLVPTFSNVVENANASSDKNLVRNINNVLEIKGSLNQLPNDKTELRKVLKEYGINETKNKANNHIIFWSKSRNMFFIWGIKEQEIIFPEYCRGMNLDDFNDEVNMSENIVTNQMHNANIYSGNYCEGFDKDSRLSLNKAGIEKITSTMEYVATGAIPIDTSKYNSLTIYISGGEYDFTPNCVIHIIINNNDLRRANGESLNLNLKDQPYFALDFKLEKINVEYYKLVCEDYDALLNELDKSSIIYFATSLKGFGEDLIITVNEEIYD